jgi:hypothetical protein
MRFDCFDLMSVKAGPQKARPDWPFATMTYRTLCGGVGGPEPLLQILHLFAHWCSRHLISMGNFNGIKPFSPRFTPIEPRATSNNHRSSVSLQGFIYLP